MVERILKVKDALLHVVTSWKETIMTIDDFNTAMAEASTYDKCLAPLQEATTKMQADKYPTISAGVNLFLLIRKGLSDIIDDPRAVLRAKELATILRARLEARLGNMMKTGLPLCAAALDLRYCHLVPADSMEQLQKDLFGYFCDHRQFTAGSDNITKKQQKRIKDDIPDLLELVRQSRNNLEQAGRVTSTHTRSFWNGELEESDENAGLISSYRSASQMIFSVPLTSASSERVFSHAGFLQSKKRCQLSPVSFVCLLFFFFCLLKRKKHTHTFAIKSQGLLEKMTVVKANTSVNEEGLQRLDELVKKHFSSLRDDDDDEMPDASDEDFDGEDEDGRIRLYADMDRERKEFDERENPVLDKEDEALGGDESD